MQKQESFRSIWALENSALFFIYAKNSLQMLILNNAEILCAFTLLEKNDLGLSQINWSYDVANRFQHL